MIFPPINFGFLLIFHCVRFNEYIYSIWYQLNNDDHRTYFEEYGRKKERTRQYQYVFCYFEYWYNVSLLILCVVIWLSLRYCRHFFVGAVHIILNRFMIEIEIDSYTITYADFILQITTSPTAVVSMFYCTCFDLLIIFIYTLAQITQLFFLYIYE